MIRNDAVITGFLQQNDIKIVGKPYVEVQNWNLDKETLDFNYCFPVDKNPKLIDNAVVEMIPAVKGLQATYLETSGPQTGLGLHCWTMRKDMILN
jgi:hypothetical protein